MYHVYIYTQEGQRILDPLELERQAVVSCLTWVCSLPLIHLFSRGFVCIYMYVYICIYNVNLSKVLLGFFLSNLLSDCISTCSLVHIPKGMMSALFLEFFPFTYSCASWCLRSACRLRSSVSIQTFSVDVIKTSINISLFQH